MIPFKELYGSPLVSQLKAQGKDPAPLQLVGHYLNTVGNRLLSYMDQAYQGKRVFFPDHKVCIPELNG